MNNSKDTKSPNNKVNLNSSKTEIIIIPNKDFKIIYSNKGSAPEIK